MRKKSPQNTRDGGTLAAESGRLKAKLVRIGNSRGIRLPKAMIEQTGLGEDVTLRADGNRIVIEKADNPRAGWAEAARKVIAKHGKELTEEDREWLDAPLSSEFDEKEWTR